MPVAMRKRGRQWEEHERIIEGKEEWNQENGTQQLKREKCKCKIKT
jgi:hypothetical protein